MNDRRYSSKFRFLFRSEINFHATTIRHSAAARRYHKVMLRYHVAFYLPKESGGMVVAEALDFRGEAVAGI
jgi:hypothetical protein